MSITVSTSSTSLSVTKNTTLIENKRQDTSIISTNSINNISSVKIAVTTVGVKAASGRYEQKILSKIEDATQLLDSHSVLSYVGSELVNKSIFENSTLSNKLYSIDFSYIDGNLFEKDITELSTSDNVTYRYSYIDGNLVSIDSV